MRKAQRPQRSIELVECRPRPGIRFRLDPSFWECKVEAGRSGSPTGALLVLGSTQLGGTGHLQLISGGMPGQAFERAEKMIVSGALGRKKKCASCGVRRTPYWRDGWSLNVVLCNACGIRYKKYRKFCQACNAISRKDESGQLACPSCHQKL